MKTNLRSGEEDAALHDCVTTPTHSQNLTYWIFDYNLQSEG